MGPGKILNRTEGSAIYTRKFGSGAQPNGLPPGYSGSAFAESIRDREEEIPQTEESPARREAARGEEVGLSAEVCPQSGKRKNGREPAEQLLRLIQGRIGSEELILTLVLLLVASDGAGAEAVILVLALLAGG